jgi:hypothetical protein
MVVYLRFREASRDGDKRFSMFQTTIVVVRSPLVFSLGGAEN